MSDTATVTVPRWAVEFILERGNFQDEGPWGEGWPSAKMQKSLDALDEALYGNGCAPGPAPSPTP